MQHESRIGVGLQTAQPVVQVSGVQLEPKFWGKGNQDVEQRHRVGPARHADQHAGPGLQKPLAAHELPDFVKQVSHA